MTKPEFSLELWSGTMYYTHWGQTATLKNNFTGEQYECLDFDE